MYAVFKDTEFVKVINELDTWNYKIDPQYTLYKIHIRGDMKPSDYEFVLSHNRSLITIPIVFHSENTIRKLEENRDYIIHSLCELENKIQNLSFIKRLKYLFTKKIL